MTIDLDSKRFKLESQSENSGYATIARPITNAAGMSFDENTKFYLCSDKLGASPNACTISEFILEYPASIIQKAEYGHLAGKYRIIFTGLLFFNL